MCRSHRRDGANQTLAFPSRLAEDATMVEHRGTLNEDLFPLVAEALRPLELGRSELREVMRGLVEIGFFTEIEAPPPDHRGVHPGRGGDPKWYAVHSTDLIPLGVTATGIAVALVTAGLTAGTVIGGMGGLLLFLVVQRREQVVLEPLDGHVLNTLNRLPGHRATVEELAARACLSVEDTRASLERIKPLRRRKLTEGKLVEALPDGTWVAVDLGL